VVMRNGELTTIDRQAVIHAAQEQSEILAKNVL